MKLDEKWVSSGMELAKEGRLFGVPFEDLSRDELLAAAAVGWKAYNDHLEQSLASAALLRSFRKAGY